MIFQFPKQFFLEGKNNEIPVNFTARPKLSFYKFSFFAIALVQKYFAGLFFGKI